MASLRGTFSCERRRGRGEGEKGEERGRQRRRGGQGRGRERRGGEGRGEPTPLTEGTCLLPTSTQGWASHYSALQSVQCKVCRVYNMYSVQCVQYLEWVQCAWLYVTVWYATLAFLWLGFHRCSGWIRTGLKVRRKRRNIKLFI